VRRRIIRNTSQIWEVDDQIRQLRSSYWVNDDYVLEKLDSLRRERSRLYGIVVADRLVLDLEAPRLINKPTASKNRQASNKEDAEPPQLLEYLLWFLPKVHRMAILGDLQEEYDQVRRKFGLSKANAWYAYQVAASFWPYLAMIVRTCPLPVKMLLTATVASAIVWLRLSSR
jgi:hypothetical protein